MTLSLASSVSALAGLASLAILALSAPISQADVIYSNFGPGDAFDTGTGYTISGINTIPGYHAIAESFTLGATTLNLDTVTVAVSNITGDSSFNIAVVTDAGGIPSSTILESFDNLTPTGSLGNSFTPETVTSVSHPSLAAGSTYWIEVTPANDNVFDAWNFNTTGAMGSAYDYGSGWIPASVGAASAFRVTGSAAVPEPGTYATIASLGLSGVALLRRRRTR